MSDLLGTNIASLRLAPKNDTTGYSSSSYFNSSDTAANLQQSGSFGRSGNPGTGFSLATWEALDLSIENPTSTYCLFDASDELELRSYGEFGTSYTARPALTAVWPNTLGNMSGSSVVGNAARRNYTTISFSRALRPYPDPAGAIAPYTLKYIAGGTYADGSPFAAPTDFTMDFGVYNVSAPVATSPGTSANVWPTTPWNTTTLKSHQTAFPRLPINPALAADMNVTPPQTLQSPSQSNWQSMYHLAATATNLATAMERLAGFTHREACAFAANYVTSMWSGLVQDSAIPSTTDTAYYFPGGPSFIDDQGICVRTAFGVTAAGTPPTVTAYPIGANFGGSTDLNSKDSNNPSGDIYLGFDAQPFINKIGAQSTSTGDGSATAVVVTDSAIELYNPYPVALSTKGYHLVDPTTSPATDIDLTKDDSGQILYVPASGFLIITTGTGAPALATLPASGGGKATVVIGKYAALTMNTVGGTIALRRPFIDRSWANQLATVDRASYTPTIFASATTATTPNVSLFIARTDVTNAGSIGSAGTVITSGPTPTFGTSAGSGAYPLYDRSTVSSNSPTPITGLTDFNRIMRIGNFIDSTGTPVPPAGTTPNGLLTERLNTLGTAPDTTPPNPNEYSAEPKEAIIHFDFWVNPTIFANTALYPTVSTPLGVDPAGKCDMRAFVLLECLAPIDRYYATNTSGSPDVINIAYLGRST